MKTLYLILVLALAITAAVPDADARKPRKRQRTHGRVVASQGEPPRPTQGLSRDSGIVDHTEYNAIAKWDLIGYVTSLLGDGTLLRSSGSGDNEVRVYEFRRPDKLGTIMVTFQNWKVIAKEQTGP